MPRRAVAARFRRADLAGEAEWYADNPAGRRGKWRVRRRAEGYAPVRRTRGGFDAWPLLLPIRMIERRSHGIRIHRHQRDLLAIDSQLEIAVVDVERLCLLRSSLGRVKSDLDRDKVARDVHSFAARKTVDHVFGADLDAAGFRVSVVILGFSLGR